MGILASDPRHELYDNNSVIMNDESSNNHNRLCAFWPAFHIPLAGRKIGDPEDMVLGKMDPPSEGSLILIINVKYIFA